MKAFFIPLGRWFGIRVYLHALVLLFFAFFGGWTAWAWIAGGAEFAHRLPESLGLLLVVLALFVSMSLHEFGHAFAAKARGLRATRIDLAIVGRTYFEGHSNSKHDEWIVALGGPLVNIGIAGVLLPFLLQNSGVLDGSTLEMRASFSTWPGIAAWICILNAAMAAFNLVPLFPMDGGRVVTGLLSVCMDWKRGVRIVTAYSIMLGAGLVAWAGVDLLIEDFVVGSWHVAGLLIGGTAISASLSERMRLRLLDLQEFEQDEPAGQESTQTETAMNNGDDSRESVSEPPRGSV